MATHRNAPAGQAARGARDEHRRLDANFSTRCAGCGIQMTWRDRRPLCRGCRATERAAAVHHLAPGRACPDCGAKVSAW